MGLLLADEWLRIPSPATPQSPPLSLLRILEVHGRGLWAQGAFPPLPRPQLPRFSLASLWKLLFSEAALGASGLTSPILRHSKRVFRQTNSGRSSAVGCGCLPAACVWPGWLAAGRRGEAGAVGLAALAGGPGQGFPIAGDPASSTVHGCPTSPDKPCKCRSSLPSNTKDPRSAASTRKSHRSTLPTGQCNCWGKTERD